jgi:hypothetical protein
MDYSTDALAGPSPWGSFSPKAGRTHQHNASQDSVTAPPAAQSEPAEPEQQAVGQEQHEQHEHPQGQPIPQQRQVAARYQRQQRPVPAYKLQAKVTALERTGRKDPVIRFDVYVSLPMCWWGVSRLTLADESTQVPNDPVPRCAPHPWRVCQAVRAPDLVQSRSAGPSRTTSSDVCWCWNRRRRRQSQELDTEVAQQRLW